MKIKNWIACVQDQGKWKEVVETAKTFNQKFSAWKKKEAATPPLLHTPSWCVNRLYLTLHHTMKFLIIITQTLPAQNSQK
jgi:hypothetical protein